MVVYLRACILLQKPARLDIALDDLDSALRISDEDVHISILCHSLGPHLLPENTRAQVVGQESRHVYYKPELIAGWT